MPSMKEESNTTLQNDVNQGIIYMLISAVCLSLMSAMVKVLTTDMPTIEVVFFRNLIGVVLISATFFKTPIKQKGGKPWLLIFRGAIGLLAMLSYFYNIAHIPLSDAVTYSRTSPIFTAIFALIFLKEGIGLRGWVAIALGFTGMLLVMQPSPTMGFDKSHIFGLLNAICAALAFTSIRELRQYYDTRAIVLSFMGIGLIIPIISMIVSEYTTIGILEFMMGQFVMPLGMDWVYLGAIGLFALLGQVYLTKAYATAKAGIVGTAGYSVILFSLVIGFLMGDNLPNTLAFFGIACIISGGVLIAKKK